ncbi:MAG: Transcription-repair-coupling factor [Firmicutes bacterium]|nr:Transcription-repair-coupling factor [candidate division NPL-UPA2 bacterium]
MQRIIKEYIESDSWYDIARAAKEGHRHLYISGATQLGKALLMGVALTQWKAPLLIVAPLASHAERLRADLERLLPQVDVAVFPAEDSLLYGVTAQSPELLGQRLALLARLSGGGCPAVVITTWDALLIRLVPPDLFRAHCLNVSVGQALRRDELLLSLVSSGYERVELVEAMGQFAVRGGIVDVFPLSGQEPMRLEFFGDSVDSIRVYDLTTQRSQSSKSSVTLPPAVEVFWPESQTKVGLEKIQTSLKATLARLDSERGRQLKRHIEYDYERLQSGVAFPGKPRYWPFFLHDAATLLDYLPLDTVVVLDEPTRLLEKAEGAAHDLKEQYAAMLMSGQILPAQHKAFLQDSELIHALERFPTVMLATLPKRPARFRITAQLTVLQKTTPSYYGQLDLLQKDIRRLAHSGYRLLLTASSPERQAELVRHLRESNIEAVQWMEDSIPPRGVVAVINAELEEGLELPDSKLIILSEGDISGKARARRRRQPKAAAEGARLLSHRDLAPGDYVVHVHHGIGKYLGMRSLQVGGVERDYIEVNYSGEDKLYVPTDQMHLIQKYVGAEGREPKVHSLGSGEWAKTKVRVKESVQKMARELVALYAERASVPGFAFGPDKPWQKEMEDNFPYVETPDQLRSIEEVKRDMQSPKVMERLLCGDVGYGKTEVAVRAAFKAILEGKQVAVLVPTTILAEQHFHTFRERFAGFPIEVAVLSRFKGTMGNKQTAKRITAGAVDLAIGTHRLLGTDVHFKDLGLLIIDEEQRFGVQHKEKVKMLKNDVDVLTLSATPIPRTLHMAMVGLRDVSVIETPPEDRYPVQTYVCEYHDGAIKHAIERELERGGQVYYVHNRVRTIKSAAAYVQSLVPNARIAIGHGQMGEEKLERIFLDFLEGEYDILLSTTIIESGLDIPNVNTIIVEEADKFGLAQLYQLRGRVGRATRVGYSYLTYQPEKNLTEVAEKRLSALREFTQLGAGFKIALRDLEIRGAGNLLGPEQHGFMASVGFDLYCQMLEEEIQNLRGLEPVKPVEVEIKLPLDAFFPGRYIRDSRQKVEMYKRVAAARSEAELDDVVDELIDRYGETTEPVNNLLNVARLKVIAGKLAVTSIVGTDQAITLKLSPDARIDASAILRSFAEYKEIAVENHKGHALIWRGHGELAVQVPRLIKALRLL